MAWLWFFSSYAPLWVMLGLRFECWPLRIGLMLFGAGCAVLVLLLLRRNARSNSSNNDPLVVTGDAGAEVSGYLAAYLFPFLTVSDPSVADLAAYGVFIAVAGIVYVRSELLQINPTVYLLGRRILRATISLDNGLKKEVFVITGRGRRVGEQLRGEVFADRVYVDNGPR